MMEKLIKKKVIAVDFGGTNIRAALAQSDGTLLHSVRLPTKAEAGQKLLTLAGDIEAITANHVQADLRDNFIKPSTSKFDSLLDLVILLCA